MRNEYRDSARLHYRQNNCIEVDTPRANYNSTTITRTDTRCDSGGSYNRSENSCSRKEYEGGLFYRDSSYETIRNPFAATSSGRYCQLKDRMSNSPESEVTSSQVTSTSDDTDKTIELQNTASEEVLQISQANCQELDQAVDSSLHIRSTSLMF